MILCNNGKIWGSDGQDFIDSFGSAQVSWEHVNHERLVQMLKKRAPVNDTLQLKGRAVVEDFNYRRVLIGKAKVRATALELKRELRRAGITARSRRRLAFTRPRCAAGRRVGS